MNFNMDENKDSTKKLADTLKRSGLVSSLHDAHRMADEINSTEKKVQEHFDKKKDELREEMVERVHGKRQEDGKRQEEKVQELQEQPVERPKVEVKVEEQSSETAGFDELQPEQPIQESQTKNQDQDVLHDDRPLKELLSEQVDPAQSNEIASADSSAVEKEAKEDYINQHIREEKEGVETKPASQAAQEMSQSPAQEPAPQTAPPQEVAPTTSEPQQQILPQEQPQAQPESSVQEEPVQTQTLEEKKDEPQQVDINEYFNHAKKDMSPSQRLAEQKEKQEETKQTQEEKQAQPQKTIEDATPKPESHPKTGDEQEVDLHSYFNFSKK